MIATLENLTLFAQRNVFRDMGSGFRDKREHFDPTDLIGWLGVVTVVVLLLLLVARLVARQDKGRLYNSHSGLFRALCAAHQLDRHQRRVLHKLVTAQGLVPPARIFLEPEQFDAARRPPALAKEKQALEALRQLLFSNCEPEECLSNPQLDESLAVLLAAAAPPATEAAKAPGASPIPLIGLPLTTSTPPTPSVR